MNDLELQIRICPKGHVLLCFGDRHLRLSAGGFRRLAQAANRVVACLDAMEADRPPSLLH